MRILIVEDEKKMASFLERGLKEEHYAVDIAYDGEKGWEYAMTNEYDLLIVDWMLPKMSGVELCGKFRNKRSRRKPAGWTQVKAGQDAVISMAQIPVTERSESRRSFMTALAGVSLPNDATMLCP